MRAYTQSIENQIKVDLENPFGREKTTPVFSLTEEELVEYLGHLTTFLRNELSRQSHNFYNTPVRKLEHNLRTLYDIVELQHKAHFCLNKKQEDAMHEDALKMNAVWRTRTYLEDWEKEYDEDEDPPDEYGRGEGEAD